MTIKVYFEVTAEGGPDLKFQLGEIAKVLMQQAPVAAETNGSKPPRGSVVVLTEEEVQEEAEASALLADEDEVVEQPAARKPKPAPAKKITEAELKKTLVAHIAKFGEPATTKVVKKHGGGATKISAIDAKYYAPLHDILISELTA